MTKHRFEREKMELEKCSLDVIAEAFDQCHSLLARCQAAMIENDRAAMDKLIAEIGAVMGRSNR